MSRHRISRSIGQFRGDRHAVLLLLALSVFLMGRGWLSDHPQHDPWAPLDLDDPPGWATERKLLALRDDPVLCREVLQRSDVVFTVLEPQGEGACRREDRTRIETLRLSPGSPATTCPVGVGLELWIRDVVRPAAREILGAELESVRHLGAFSCRRLYGRDEGPWSEHATGNAIDIAGFTFSNRDEISVQRDWRGDAAKAAFVREVRDGACPLYATVLSPDYNAAHSDHFHFDMSDRWTGLCR